MTKNEAVKIRPVKKSSIGDMIFAKMRELILTGEWKAEDKIPTEKELCCLFGVSRISIREAVGRLTALGLLKSKFGGGTHVEKITLGLNMNLLVPVAYLNANVVLDVVEYRQVIERKIAGLAARRATAQDMEALEVTWQRMSDAQDSPKEFANADMDFHFELARITGNSLLIETFNILRSMLRQVMAVAIKYRGTKGLHYHRLLINAIREHDEKLAMSIMEEHIDNVYNTLKEKIEEEKYEEDFGGDVKKVIPE